MEKQPRIYESILEQHLAEHRQMVFLGGARQTGKTTIAKGLCDTYLDWDSRDHQQLILQGPDDVARHCGLDELRDQKPVIAFDELHKFPRWKNFLKGFFDVYENKCRIMVTGSARLDVYRRGGDSLMGRYFPYHLHPFSCGELLRQDPSDACTAAPGELPEEAWARLIEHGGFPEPLLKGSERFSHRWRNLRNERLLKEDLRDLTRIHELALLEILATVLAGRSGEQLVYANLARQVQVAPNTLKSWVETLVSSYYGFLVRPWHRNVDKALRKEPKWFLRDWSGIADRGKRAETFVACHLLKAVDLWTDLGMGTFELRYLRDKQKREVDFIVIRDNEPWFLVEVKKADKNLSPALGYFQQKTGAPHAFQVVIDMPFVDADCFAHNSPTVVPARTLLSQLP